MICTSKAEGLIIELEPSVKKHTSRKYLIERSKVEGEFEYKVRSITSWCGQTFLKTENAQPFLAHLARYVFDNPVTTDELWEELRRRYEANNS